MSPVTDNEAAHRFEIEVEGRKAVAVYERRPGLTIFLHAEVPPAFAGRGIGSQLAKGALDQTRARGDKVIARCPFIAAYIDKHPEYRDLLAG
jgi:uncharacterized protein